MQQSPRFGIALCLLLGAACRRGDNLDTGGLAVGAYARDTVIFGETRAVEPRDSAIARDARAPDRRFLERLLDHFEGLDYLAARMVRSNSARRAQRQAWRFDTQEDPDKHRVAELLRSRYRERYIPITPAHFKHAADSLSALPHDEQHGALVRMLAQHHRDDVAEIDSVMPSLRDPAVKRLADELRRDQSRELARLLKRLEKLET